MSYKMNYMAVCKNIKNDTINVGSWHCQKFCDHFESIKYSKYKKYNSYVLCKFRQDFYTKLRLLREL
jgi:hypothetical protein